MSKAWLIQYDPKFYEEVEREVIKDGIPLILPFEFYKEIPQLYISTLCVKNGLYCIPTEELVCWLKEQIYKEENNTIEIGSGNGVLGKALGIRCTDSYLQEDPEIRKHYELAQQAPVRYGSHVEKIDAEAAIKKYRPKIVIGAWITQKWWPGDSQGNIYGIDEIDMLKRIDKYIHIGHVNTHSNKRIRDNRTTYCNYADFLVGRSMDIGNIIEWWEN